MNKLTLRKAFSLSIKKWVWLSEKADDGEDLDFMASNNSVIKAIPSIRGLEACCGLCEYKKQLNLSCEDCPLFVGGNVCADEGHVWSYWTYHPTKHNARRVLALIRKKKKEMK